MTDNQPKIVVILGATGNLGRACVDIFQQQGAHTVLVDRSIQSLDDTFRDCDSVTHTLVGGVDLANWDAVVRFVGSIDKRFNRIDVIVNTVGMFQGGEPVHSESIETWSTMFDVNLYTALLTERAVVPVMLRNGAGRIINVISRDALRGVANYAAYSAAKAALLRMSESMAAELKADNILVNCVIPGTIDTPQNRESMPNADVSQWVAPSAIADVIAFLAADESRAVTGAAIPVYGRG